MEEVGEEMMRQWCVRRDVKAGLFGSCALG